MLRQSRPCSSTENHGPDLDEADAQGPQHEPLIQVVKHRTTAAADQYGRNQVGRRRDSESGGIDLRTERQPERIVARDSSD
jgi:hypothetical protein